MAYIDEQPRYTSLIDLIDGGGAGRSGERFEGGGLLSILANALTRPYGYEDRLRDRKSDTAETITDVINEITEGRLQGRRGFEPTNDQIAPPAAVSQIPAQNYESTAAQMQRSEFGMPIDPINLSQNIAPKADEIEDALAFANQIAQPGFVEGSLFGGFNYLDTDYNRLDPYASQLNYIDKGGQAYEKKEETTSFTPPQNYESTAAQMQRAEFPMINQNPDPVTEANLISMLYDDEIKRKQRGLGLGELTGFEQARQMIMEQAPVLLENKTPQEQFEIIMLMKESRGL